MEIEKQQTIKASLETVYTALNNPEVLRECIPGCEKIEMTSGSTMDAIVTLKIGPVKASFEGTLEITDLTPPTNYTLNFTGKGGAAGEASGSATVVLEPDKEGGTVIDYKVNADITGKIAHVGNRLISSTAKILVKRFFKNFAQQVEHEEN